MVAVDEIGWGQAAITVDWPPDIFQWRNRRQELLGPHCAFEPPGETHTLVVPEDVEEMITLFHVTGSMIYMDPHGNVTGYEDVFTKIEACRRHYEAIGLGGDYVRQFIR